MDYYEVIFRCFINPNPNATPGVQLASVALNRLGSLSILNTTSFLTSCSIYCLEMIEIHDYRFNPAYPLKIEIKRESRSKSDNSPEGVGCDIMRPKLPISMQNGNKFPARSLVGGFTGWLIAHGKVTRKLLCCN